MIISGPFITLQHLFIGFPSLLCLILLPGQVNKYYLIMDYPIRYFIRPRERWLFLHSQSKIEQFFTQKKLSQLLLPVFGSGPLTCTENWQVSFTLPIPSWIILLQGREQQGNRWEADLTGSANYFHPRIFIIRCLQLFSSNIQCAVSVCMLIDKLPRCFAAQYTNVSHFIFVAYVITEIIICTCIQ